MAPRNSLISHSLSPPLYFSESPYTPKYPARALGRDVLTARVLPELPGCKLELETEDFPESEVDGGGSLCLCAFVTRV